jgi:hypothetical protein
MTDHDSEVTSAGTVQYSNVQPPAKPGFWTGFRHWRKANRVADKYHILFSYFLSVHDTENKN